MENIMLVKDAMTPTMTTVPPNATIQECAQKMKELDVGILPVSAEEKIVGLVTDRDVCCRAIGNSLDPKTTMVRDIMTKGVTLCFSDQDLGAAAHLMEEKHVRRLPVINRDSTIAGILSIDDLAHYSHNLAGEVIDATAPRSQIS
jgi:CBS domain-containing protein